MNLPADKEYIGLIAQEAREVIPEAVEEGENSYMMVNDSAIKELEAKFDFLKKRIYKLEKAGDDYENNTIAPIHFGDFNIRVYYDDC